MEKRRILLTVAIFVIALCMAGVACADPMGTAFTYQGRLYDANSPAEGEYDLQFKLFNSPSDGNQVGGPVNVNEVDMVGGVFTAKLDFGVEVFHGDDVWLHVAVRPGEIEGDNSFVTLSPRQEITPVPYALHTRGIFVDADGNVGISTMQPTEKLEVNGDIKVNNIRMSNSDITDNGSIRMIIDEDNDQANQTFSVWKDGAGGTELLRVQENGNVGIGTIMPWAKLEVETDSGNAIYATATAPTGTGVYGAATASGSGVENYGGHFVAVGDSGRAIYGMATAVGGAQNYGGYFEAAGEIGKGVYGTVSGTLAKGVYGNATGGAAAGVYGEATGESGRGVDGYAVGSQGQGVQGVAAGIQGIGVKGMAGGDAGHGVHGEAIASGDVENYGGYFTAAGDMGYGVLGQALAGDRVTNYGGWFIAYGDTGRGVHGECPGDWGVGVHGEVSGNLGKAVVGQATATGTFQNYGGYFEAWGDDGRGVYGKATATIGDNYGGYFTAAGDQGRGVYGLAQGSSGKGVYGEVSADSSDAVAVYGYTNAQLTPNAYAGYFEGKVDITKKLTVGDNAYISGNLAIGSTNTTKKLAVRGNILLESVGTGDPVVELGEGLDYAEGFDVTEEADVEPGTVLVIDADNPGKLTVSRSAYDSRVAGIVAGAKGLGSGVRLGVSQFDQNVALAGRVYCNVDATETGVEPGDLLTTSARPGYAMKATDYIRAQGAILGKAMEKLEQNKKGQIMVLVTLQ